MGDRPAKEEPRPGRSLAGIRKANEGHLSKCPQDLGLAIRGGGVFRFRSAAPPWFGGIRGLDGASPSRRAYGTRPRAISSS